MDYTDHTEYFFEDETYSIREALSIIGKHGIDTDEFFDDFNPSDEVNCIDLFRWLGY